MASIFDELAGEQKGQVSSIFEEIASTQEKLSGREKTEQTLTDIAQQAGRKFLSSALASPKTLAEFIRSGSQYLAEKGAEGGEIDPFTQKVLTGLGFPAAVLERIGYPSQASFEEMIMFLGERTGAQQLGREPVTPAGRRAAAAGEFAGYAALGAPRSLAERLLFGAIGGLGAQEAEEMGAGAGGQIGAAIALPTAIQLASQIRTGKFIPKGEEAKQLADFFRRELGMAEEEIVPLLQPKGKQKALGLVAKGDEKVADVLSRSRIKLGEGYEQLKETSKTLPPASREQTKTLLKEFENISQSLKQSRLPSDEKINAIKKIDKAIEEIAFEGITPEGIIETSIDINDAVNWGSYKQGKKDLAKLKKPLKELYREISPEGAATFDKLNEGWSRLKSIEKTIGPNNFKSMMTLGKGVGFFLNAIKNVATGNVPGLIKSGTSLLGVELSQNLAKKMLLDPKYQNLMIKGAAAVKKGARPQMLKAYDDLASQIIEDFPEESKKIDWEELKRQS